MTNSFDITQAGAKRYFNFKEHTLCYFAKGIGANRILFVHGLCGNKDLWSKQAQYFSETHEVILIDCLNHGESSKVSPLIFIESTAEILAAFLKSLPPKATALVGHSFGGLIINELIERFLHYAYLFVDSPCLNSAVRLKEYNEFAEVIKKSMDRKAMIAKWFGEFVTNLGTAENRSAIVGEALKFEPEWIADVMGNVLPPRKMEKPFRSFVIEGQQFFPAGNDSSWMQFYPESDFWRYPGDGHFYFLEDPKPFNQNLFKFLSHG